MIGCGPPFRKPDIVQSPLPIECIHRYVKSGIKCLQGFWPVMRCARRARTPGLLSLGSPLSPLSSLCLRHLSLLLESPSPTHHRVRDNNEKRSDNCLISHNHTSTPSFRRPVAAFPPTYPHHTTTQIPTCRVPSAGSNSGRLPTDPAAPQPTVGPRAGAPFDSLLHDRLGRR